MEVCKARSVSESVPVPSLASSHRQLSVAVIGAGAAGLVAAKELQREGHQVVVFEQHKDATGGVWLYSPQTEEDDPLGFSPHRNRVHSSMYLSLRTNLPREVMGFLDFPFLPKHQAHQDRDARRYPNHQEVLSYLQDFASHFNLLPCIHMGRRVTHIGIRMPLVNHKCRAPDDHARDLNSMLEEGAPFQWYVTTEGERYGNGTAVSTDVFDAVVVCNGHYFQPKVPSIPGIGKWPGKQLHSHNYRVPQPFINQSVVVIGNSSSGADISREIATVAKTVHLVARTWDVGIDMEKPVGLLQNIWLHPMVSSAHEDGKLMFADGASVGVDAIVYCTGYAFSVPFLESEGMVRVDEDHIEPLYQHVFPPLLAPSLSFVGLPFKVVPFPLMQLQSRWIAMALSNKVALPSKEAMIRQVEEFYESMNEKGIPKSKVHDLSSCQFEYDNWLAAQCGCDQIEDWRIQIYINSSKHKRLQPDTYRDEWTDQDLHETAITDLLAKSVNHIQC